MKIYRLCRLLGVLFVSVIPGLVMPAEAGTILDNGGPNTTNGFYIHGTDSTADDFTLGSNTGIWGVGFYFQNYNGITGWNLDISYNIRADSSGSLGSILASGVGQNLVAVDSGLPWCCGGGNAYLVTFNLQSPFNATGGTTYWLELTGASGSAPDAWWVTANANSTHTGYSNFGGGYQDVGQQFAFFLTDTPFASGVPEPSSYALVLGGLSFLGCMAVRRRTL